MVWNLYSEGKFIEPLCFSNGKTQKEIIEEVLDSVKKGCKIIFIRGVCGTGKSSIALNIARNMGKASIVVPGKTLQNQYKDDYEKKKYLLKKNGEKLKISVIMGRNNFKCKFLEQNKIIPKKDKKEINSNLNDIFEFSKEEIETKKREDLSADNWSIPCKIEIKEKNSKKIREYLRQNRKINPRNIADIKNIKRISVASVCPYWCPVLPEEYDLKIFENAEKRKYLGLDNTNFVFYKRKSGCGFYEQFDSFIDADVIIFNSLKYQLESALKRKPATDVEIIDECDEFLDSFSNQRTINLNRLQNALSYFFPENETDETILNDLNILIKNIKKDKKTEAAVYSKAILKLKETQVYNLLRLFAGNQDSLCKTDEENYLHDIMETARMFDEFLDETYVMFHKQDNGLIIELVTTDLAKKFKNLVDKNKIIVLMSGTIHSENVLRNIFGLEEYSVIDAEIQQQGEIEIARTGLEFDCKYENFSKGIHTREKYLEALSKCIEIAKKPSLVHINSFYDLPSEEEIKKFGVDNLIGREKLKELQREDKQGKIVNDFKNGKIDILFSTKVSRGIDFPGEKCNSIIFTKYPNPDVKSAFWKILKQTKPNYYWDFYKDKARRELLQRIYRGLRSKEDHVFLLSPDERVLKAFEK
jgi:Rad3-related DNA helicase